MSKLADQLLNDRARYHYHLLLGNGPLANMYLDLCRKWANAIFSRGASDGGRA